MFSKSAKFKPASAIKNSERKNVLARIQEQCGLDDCSVEQKQLLLPKSVQSANGVSHGGDKIVVYSEEQLPLWIGYKSRLIPTVALMLRLPADLQTQLLPVVYTVARTLQFLQNGADFMTPGIFGDLPQVPVAKGAPVQIRDLEGGGVLATGLALRDLSTITQEDTGKCVQTISVIGDKLTPNTKLVSLNTSAAEQLRESEQPKQPENPEVDIKAADKPTTAAANVLSEDPPVESLHLSDSENEDELSPKEVDEAFLYAVNKVIRQARHEYPMTMAAFAALLGENLPYEHPQLNIKNTTFKKMGKLLKQAEKLGLIRCRDRQGGEVMVMGVNVPQNEIEPEQPVRKSKKNSTSSAKMAASVLYKPKPSLRDILEPELAGLDLVEAGKLRKSVLSYISQQKLLTPSGEVSINEPLRKALGLRQTVATIKREEVGEVVLKQCTIYHRILSPGQSADEAPWTKGPVPTIHIKTERRGGNKTVTLVQTAGLVGFKIDVQELADELRHACAGSSTVTDVKGANCIVVQGNHVSKIIKVLEKRGIKPAWVKSS